MRTDIRSPKLLLAAGLGLVVLGLIVSLSVEPAQAQVPRTVQAGARQLTFEDRLVFGLQARRPSELAFIEAVIETIERDELPRRLVDRVFFWSRRHADAKIGRSVRPIIYFQAALVRLAVRMDIKIRRTPPPTAI